MGVVESVLDTGVLLRAGVVAGVVEVASGVLLTLSLFSMISSFTFSRCSLSELRSCGWPEAGVELLGPDDVEEDVATVTTTLFFSYSHLNC